MRVLSMLKREVRHVVGVALYLFFCFGIFATLKKLFLATYQIEFAALVPAVIGALALAKVVVFLDMTPVATRPDTRHPIWVATLYKTLFYCAVSAPVLFAEGVACLRRDPCTRRSRLAGVEAYRSKRRVGQNDHCRPSLCLLPPLPRNRPPSWRRQTPAHDLQSRMRAAMAPQFCGRPDGWCVAPSVGLLTMLTFFL